MHTYYGLETIEGLPLSIVSKLLANAKKKETEKMMYPMWLVHVIQASINKTEIKSLDDFLNLNTTTENSRTAEEIENDMSKIVDIYRKGGANGKHI